MDIKHTLSSEEEHQFEAYIKNDLPQRAFSSAAGLLSPAKWKGDRFVKYAFLPIEPYADKLLKGALLITAAYAYVEGHPFLDRVYTEFQTADYQQVQLMFEAKNQPPSKQDILVRIAEKCILHCFPESLTAELENLGFSTQALPEDVALVNLNVLHFYDYTAMSHGFDRMAGISIVIRIKIPEQLSEAFIETISAHCTLPDKEAITQAFSTGPALPTKGAIHHQLQCLVNARNMAIELNQSATYIAKKNSL